MIRLGILSLEHPHSTGNHLPALRYIQDRVSVSAIYHDSRSDADEWLDLFGADFHQSRDELLARDDIDAVLITSRNSHHAADTIAAARAGKDVLCDKPIATTYHDTIEMVQAVRAEGVRFITTYPVRFNISVGEVRSVVESGALGEIRAVVATNHGCMYEPGVPDWVRDPAENGGGCLIDHTVHVADIIRWITGSEYETVTAMISTGLRDIPAEDVAVLHGELSNGTLFQIDASWSRKASDPMWGDVTIRVVGERGSATLDLYNNQRIELYGTDGIEHRYPNHLLREHGEIFLDYSLMREAGSTRICADEIDGLRTMELVFAAYASAESRLSEVVKREQIA